MLNALKVQLYTFRTLLRGLLALRQRGLSAIVNEIERELFLRNETVVDLAYSWPRRLLDAATRHPWTSLLVIVAIYLAVCLGTLLIQPAWLHLHVPNHVDDYYRDFANVNIGILAAQATLVAIVYPLVIALVGLLFEPRTTLGGRLSVFLQETAAIPTGASALLLCAAAAVQIPAASQFPVRIVAAGTAVNCLWFLLNTIGLGYVFLRNAIAYIHPKTRPQLIRSYLVNVAWRTQLRNLAAFNRQFGAVEYGYLPGARSTAEGAASDPQNDGQRPTVLISPIFRDVGNPAATVSLWRKRALRDIRLPVLDVVARSWLEAARSKPAPSPQRREIPRLVFAPVYGETYSGTLVLARTPDGHPLDWAQRLLVRLAYRFRAPSRVLDPPGTETFIKEAVADLILLIEAGRVHEFEAQLDALVELHVFLFQIAEVPDTDGSSFNYAQMEARGPWSVGYEWATEYRDLFGRAVSQLAHEPEFFARCAYVAARLYSKSAETTAPSALKTVHDIAQHLCWRLRDWPAATHKAESGWAGHAGTVFELPVRTADIYAGAWRSFVAGWERLPSYFYGGRADRGERS